MQRFRTIGWAAVAGMLVIAMIAPAASSARPSARPLVLRTKFTRISGLGSVGGLKTSRQYALVYTRSGSDTVIDDRTGASQPIPAGCASLSLTGSTLALACQDQASGQETLDDLQTGQASTFTINPTILVGCGTPDTYTCPSVSATGTDWVALSGPSGNYHIGSYTVFQNRATGQIVSQSTDPKSNIDLDARGLTVPVCSPLTVPELENSVGVTRTGSLLAVGHGFEIATGNQSYLERCGTHLRIHLYSLDQGGSISTSACTAWFCPPATNAHSVVWATNSPETDKLQSISGLFLPSKRRFTIKPTTAIPRAHGTVALTNGHLYLYADNQLWRAPAPTLGKR